MPSTAQRALLVSAPLAFAALLMLHPTGGDDFAVLVSENLTAWLAVHYGAAVLFPLMGYLLYVLIRDLPGRAATVARYAIPVYAVVYGVYEAMVRCHRVTQEGGAFPRLTRVGEGRCRSRVGGLVDRPRLRRARRTRVRPLAHRLPAVAGGVSAMSSQRVTCASAHGGIELGVLGRVLPLRQRGGPRPPRRPALGRLHDAVGRLRRDRAAPAQRRLGRGRRAAGRRGARAGGRRRRADRALHQHDAQGRRAITGAVDIPSSTSPTPPPRRSAPRATNRRPARHGLHDGAGLLRRAAARPPRARRARPRRGRPRAGPPRHLRRAVRRRRRATPRARSTAV